jgi:hypothetical protein
VRREERTEKLHKGSRVNGLADDHGTLGPVSWLQGRSMTLVKCWNCLRWHPLSQPFELCRNGSDGELPFGLAIDVSLT